MTCERCGLVNYETESVCRRCQAPLGAPPAWGGSVAAPPQQQYPQQQYPQQQYPQQSYPQQQYPQQQYPVQPEYGGPPTSTPYWTPQTYGAAPYPGVQGAFGAPPPGGGVWSDGTSLVMYKNAQLPDRCVKCNVPVGGRRLRRKLWYINPLLYILAISPLIFVIVYMIVRKGATIDIGLCERHVQRRRTMLTIAWCMFALAIVSFPVAAMLESPWPALLGVLLLVGSIIPAVLGNNVVTPAKIDDTYAWLKGVCPEYLASLPPAR
jgi:hypothetical protein